jgi:hypothetical protein
MGYEIWTNLLRTGLTSVESSGKTPLFFGRQI